MTPGFECCPESSLRIIIGRLESDGVDEVLSGLLVVSPALIHQPKTGVCLRQPLIHTRRLFAGEPRLIEPARFLRHREFAPVALSQGGVCGTVCWVQVRGLPEKINCQVDVFSLMVIPQGPTPLGIQEVGFWTARSEYL